MSIESIVSRRAARKDKLRELMQRTREQLIVLTADKPQGITPSEQPEHAPESLATSSADETKEEVREQVVRGLSEEAPDGGLAQAEISPVEVKSTASVKPAKRKRSPAKSTQRARVK